MKKAYPNYDAYIPTKHPYDLSKWMDTVKNIYVKIHLGNDKTACIDELTSNWNTIEKKDFIDWLKFYEGGNHLKYKTAQSNYYVSKDIPGYFLPNPKNVPSPIKNVNNDIIEAADVEKTLKQDNSQERKKEIIENQRKKLIGRLHSLEKLLGSDEGHLFAGSEFENLLKSIYELKRQIQTLNKTSLSNQIYIDLIIRQSNILKNNGYNNSCVLLNKFAQQQVSQVPGMFNAGPPSTSKIDSGKKDDLESPVPNNLGTPPPVKPEKDAIDRFLENLETQRLTTTDEEDKAKTDDADVEVENVSNDDDIIINAQLAPQKQVVENEPIKQKTYDELLDDAFKDITVNDIVEELEKVITIFKQRQIPRRLSTIDMMLQKLNLASFFDNLGESISRSLATNQYIMTRLEDIHSKLQGSITISNATPLAEKNIVPENAKNVAQKLKEQEEKEKARKELRKQQEQKDLLEEQKPEPALEVENIPQELQQPVAKVEKPVI